MVIKNMSFEEIEIEEEELDLDLEIEEFDEEEEMTEEEIEELEHKIKSDRIDKMDDLGVEIDDFIKEYNLMFKNYMPIEEGNFLDDKINLLSSLKLIQRKIEEL